MGYVLISKDKYDRDGWQGKRVLVSYAQCAIWKSFESLHRQNDTPSVVDLIEGKRILNKYTNPDNYELITQQQFELEYSEFVNNKTTNNVKL